MKGFDALPNPVSGTKGGSFALFFRTPICLSLSRSKSKTSLCFCIAGLIRLARRSSRSLLAAPNARRCTYPVAGTAMTQRLPLCQGKPNILSGRLHPVRCRIALDRRLAGRCRSDPKQRKAGAG